MYSVACMRDRRRCRTQIRQVVFIAWLWYKILSASQLPDHCRVAQQQLSGDHGIVSWTQHVLSSV